MMTLATMRITTITIMITPSTIVFIIVDVLEAYLPGSGAHTSTRRANSSTAVAASLPLEFLSAPWRAE